MDGPLLSMYSLDVYRAGIVPSIFAFSTGIVYIYPYYLSIITKSYTANHSLNGLSIE